MIDRDGFLFEWKRDYHTVTICAWWRMPHWHVSITPTCIVAGPFQISIQNRAFTAEFQRALARKHHGKTIEERMRGAADFALMSRFSTPEVRTTARRALSSLAM